MKTIRKEIVVVCPGVASGPVYFSCRPASWHMVAGIYDGNIGVHCQDAIV